MRQGAGLNLADIPASAARDESGVTEAIAHFGRKHLPLPLRLIRDPAFAIRALRYALRLPTPLRTRDRWVLEQVILPAVEERSGNQTVVFVGCDYYTWHYKRFFKGHRYITIDPDQGRARFGGKEHHVDFMSNLPLLLAAGSVDAIICNGVVGFGVNDPQEADRSFTACANVLKPGGLLVLGWTPGSCSFDPMKTAAISRHFEPGGLPSLGSNFVETPTAYRQTFAILSRRAVTG